MPHKDHTPEEVVYHAGFPNAGEDAASIGLSLDNLVVRQPASTYFWRLSEDTAPQLGWLAGDIVVVDRSLQPSAGDWVVAVVDDEFVLCRYVSNTNLSRASGEKIASAVIWGVVTYVVQKARGR